MANRSMQQKLLKMKRRNRFARFSGATTKFAVRVKEVLETDGEDKVSIKRVEVLVGPVSLSKAVMSTGRGPDQERMAEYYSRVRPESFIAKTLAEEYDIKDPRYNQIWNDTPKENRVNLEDTPKHRLDLYFIVPNTWFFVEVLHFKKVIRRSRVYGSRAFAMGRLSNGMITWVEEVNLK